VIFQNATYATDAAISKGSLALSSRVQWPHVIGMSFSPTVRESFNHWKQGDLLGRLEASDQQLLDRRREVVESAPQHEPRKHTASNCQVLQQALLHRAERLLAGAGTMLLENNVYGLALIVRGHYEATAVLGYVCNRLESLKAGNIVFEDFALNVACEVLGARHSQFAKAPNPPNILTCIEKADRYLDTHYFKKKIGILRDNYNWLSDFAHPNFLSHCSAYTIDKANRRFVFRHEGDIQESDFELMLLLDISAGLFIRLFDDCIDRLTENSLTE
jgi:hypothetical protein